MQRSPFAQSFEELPPSLPIFPLMGAVVMPSGFLPLHIFEPRYLDMISDAMRGDQMIGMIQPQQDHANASLHQIGTGGRIVQFEETQDGRYNVVLNGLCRFDVERELDTVSAYRMVIPDWSSYTNDYEEEQAKDDQMLALLRESLKHYLDQLAVDPKWKEVVDSLPADQLVCNSVSYLPLSAQDKQLLLETNGLDQRIATFVTILEMGDAEGTRH